MTQYCITMESTLWERKELPVQPKHTLLLTEHTHCPSTIMSPFLQHPITGTTTSSLSSDSGLDQRSSTGSSSTATFSPEHVVSSPSDPPLFSLSASPVPTVPFSLQHLLVTSGPGFSIGVFPCGDSEDHTYERLSVPIIQEGAPQETITQSLELANIFAMAEILCTTMPSENQLWIGTDKGTLHSLELTQQQSFESVKPTDSLSQRKNFKLTNHTWLALNEPLVSIAARPLEYVFPSESPTTSLSIEEPPKSEVLVGVPYGYVVILHGEVNEMGRFKDPLERISRRIVRLTNSPIDCNVKCITHVPHTGSSEDETNKETYWCSCGGDIIVLQSSNWSKICTINAREVQSVTTASRSVRNEVIQMLVCDMGVWVGVSQSSTVVLWDKVNYEPKLSITYCDPHRSRQQRSHISILHYTNPYLFIGTQRGDIMVFQINTNNNNTTKQSPQKSKNNKQHSYTFITNTSVGHRPILNIYTTPTETRPQIPPLGSISSGDSFTSPTPYQSSIHVLIITGSTKNETTSEVLLYELTLPNNLSVSLRSSPTLSVGSNSTMGSIRSNTPLSVTPGKIHIYSSVGDFTPLRDRGTERRNSSFL